MNPTELLERLYYLSVSGKATDTVLIAPLNVAQASADVANFNRLINYSKHDFGNSSVTVQDLREFLEWVQALRFPNEN
jgi:hypothetical protein